MLVGLCLGALVVGGCAQTLRARGVDQSGFLGADYDLLGPGSEQQAQRRYLRSGVDWAAYRNILLDPVTVWKGKESTGRGISAENEQMLANYFYDVIRRALEHEGFKLVDSPRPATLLVKVAITKPKESQVALSVASVVPPLLTVSALDRLATGRPAFVGEAQLEVKVTDALSGELLAAGIDHRVGGKRLDASMFTSWGDVEAMMRLWANHGAYELCRLQHRANCVLPPKSRSGRNDAHSPAPIAFSKLDRASQNASTP